jgi:hypothetical protein
MMLRDPCTQKIMVPNDQSFPTREWLQERILEASDYLDSATQDTWGVIQHKDYIMDRGDLWWLTNTYRFNVPWQRGGWQTQLINPILPWDPSKGDKLEIRVDKNNWVDITDQIEKSFWFDYEGGSFFWMQATISDYNKFRITYRYGRDCAPPNDLKSACIKYVGIEIMQTDWYRSKLAGGGELSSKSETKKEWKEYIDRTIVKYFNCGTAQSLLP